jgi:hypothetical protein
MGQPSSRLYTTKIIKAGALLADTRTLLANYDVASSVSENLARFRGENLFGKASRSRVEDILGIFRQRYLGSAEITAALVTLASAALPTEAVDCLLYFHATQADLLLHDIVTEHLYDMHAAGRIDVDVSGVRNVLCQFVAEGRTAEPWSEPTIDRVARGLLATLRDFGVLEGASRKRLGLMFLPVEAFCHIAFCLWQNQPSGERLLVNPEWRLFFMARPDVERALIEAHQRHLLEYHAAGSIIRITFPVPSLSEYAHVIAQATI